MIVSPQFLKATRLNQEVNKNLDIPAFKRALRTEKFKKLSVAFQQDIETRRAFANI